MLDYKVCQIHMSITQKKNKNRELTVPAGFSLVQPTSPPVVKYTPSSIMCFFGVSAAREVASAKKSSARKNNTIDDFIMFGRMEMIKGEEIRKDI